MIATVTPAAARPLFARHTVDVYRTAAGWRVELAANGHTIADRLFTSETAARRWAERLLPTR